MLARNEHENVKKTVAIYEFIVYSMCALVFTCAAVLIVPFVAVYTRGVQDVDYYRPVFAYLMCAAEGLMLLRWVYLVPVHAAGHFRETRNSAIVEVAVNLAVSLVLIYPLGIIGVVLGTMCSIVYRLFYLINYVYRHILGENPLSAVKRMAVLFCNAAGIIAIARLLPQMSDLTLLAWFLHALAVFGVAVCVTGVFALLFYRPEIQALSERLGYIFKAGQSKK
jgi:O-antigen/teichoic acid export membrane protein